VIDDEDDGFVKLHVRRGTDRLVGATIVARHAGETLNEVTLAMDSGLGLATLTRVIYPYPTQAEAVRHAADSYVLARLGRFRRLTRAWLTLTR
jgi:pyruvate/2-oxoglutarate dehydrogenase complex dihydrolipoamide dehydrogenase (E3) component